MSDQSTLSSTPRLLPPEGAEPGSVWMLHVPEDRMPSIFSVMPARWNGKKWEVERVGWVYTPQWLAERGYTLDDLHGVGAAVRLLEAAGVNYCIDREEVDCGRRFEVTVYTERGEWPIATHADSALAAAQAALRQWREAPA